MSSTGAGKSVKRKRRSSLVNIDFVIRVVTHLGYDKDF